MSYVPNQIQPVTSTPSPGADGLPTYLIGGNVASSQGSSAVIGAPWPVRLSDGSAAFGTSINPVYVRHVDRATFVVLATAVAPALDKAMVSIENNVAGSALVSLRDARIINSQSTNISGVFIQFDLLRFTTHSGGTLITALPHDTDDSVDANVSARTDATLVGTAASPMRRWSFSSDEWGSGSLESESQGSIIGAHNSLLAVPDATVRPIAVRPGGGIAINCITNTAVGQFDIWMVFTQE